MSNMRLDLSLQQRPELQLRLAPQIIQSIEILQLPALDLKDMIEEELLENETLEIRDGPENRESTALDRANQESHENAEFEAAYDRLERMVEEEGSYSYGSRRPELTEDGKDRKLEALQNTAAREPGLKETLIAQLTWASVPERLAPLVKAIIYSLDESGYLLYPLEEVLRIVNSNAECEEPWTAEEAEAAIRIVQDLEPRGVGARNLAEGLLLQIGDDEEDAEVLRRLVRDHLDDVEKNRVPKIAHDLGISVERVNELIQRVSRLDPRPGAALASTETYYISPDVMLEWEDGEYRVRLENGYIPALRISPRYLRLLHDHRQDPKVREHIKKKIEAARWLIDSIQQRQNTLERVVCAIVRRQRDFLDFGITHLKPLKMQEIADELSIHVSTVSRAIADKYVQTHRGIFALKYFFTGGTESDDGSVESRASVKQKVLAIIEAEDKANPLSDEEIADRLQKEGLNIARRTVTKYRKQLKIQSSRQRRVWS
jgi:RNA polymerase sigma-54 factor